MSVVSFVSQVIADVRSCGVSFALANFRQRWGSGTPAFNLRGRNLVVRAGESDFRTFRQVFRDREYAVNQPEIAARLLAYFDAIVARGNTPVIVDAGANIGAASLWFLDAFKGCQVVAIEPDDQNAIILRRNLVADRSATVLEAAIGSQAGRVEISRAEGGWATRTRRAEEGVSVVTINQAVAVVPQGELFIVKVDIEGFESDLFSTNLDWLDQASAVFVEPHDWMVPEQRTSRSFQRAFAERDFDILITGENLLYVRGA